LGLLDPSGRNHRTVIGVATYRHDPLPRPAVDDLAGDGAFVLRERIEHLGAGNGFGIGTGTWTLVRGTGAYSDATGGGLDSQAESETSQRWTERRSGFITVR
jgi:hypothetical protein